MAGTDHEGRGYEQRDARARPILITGAALAGLVALALVMGAGVLDSIVSDIVASRPEPSPLSRRDLPPYPRLDTDEPASLARWRAAEDAQLGSYGWVDPVLGRVHVPIERAMRRLAERGLPSWPRSPPEQEASEARRTDETQHDIGTDAQLEPLP